MQNLFDGHVYPLLPVFSSSYVGIYCISSDERLQQNVCVDVFNKMYALTKQNVCVDDLTDDDKKKLLSISECVEMYLATYIEFMMCW